MAKLNNFCFMATLLFLAIIMISNTYAYTEEIIEIDINPALEPEGSYIIDVESNEFSFPSEPANIDFLQKCTKKMTSDCSENIFVCMFDDVVVNRTCCLELVQMGEACHFALVENVFSSPVYKANANSGLLRSRNLWNQCAILADEYD